MILTKLKDKWPLLLLTAIQLCVLCYNYGNIPFYHDELSAIERCKFNGFIDLIQQGVMVDGHPAGVHLFLYLMIQIFGIHEWILKIPFILAGLGSLVFLYSISAFIFTRYAAIASSIFFIFMSYYIAQIIVVRPYAPGLFFSLGAFYYAITLKKAPFKKYGYVMMWLFSTGAMYSHYFSFLQVIFIWLIVFLFNHKKIYLRYYFIAIAASIACFLPHITITWHQLGMGGLGWLGQPDIRFFGNFFYTWLNSNIPLITIASALLILSFFVKKPRKKNKAALMLLFILPCLVLFTYSVTLAPVLQAPALYFCSPFLLLIVGSGIDFFKPVLKLILLVLLFLYNFYVLVFLNQYYQLRDYQPMEKFVISAKNFVGKNIDSKTLVLWTGNSKYIRYYLDKQQFNHRFISTDTLQHLQLIDLKGYDKIICSQLPPPMMFELNKIFPSVSNVENNLLYSFMVLSKDTANKRLYSAVTRLRFSFDTGKDWSQTSFTFKINNLVADRFHFIEFIPQLDTIVKGAEMILETYDGDKRIDWRSVYLEPGNMLSIKLKDVIRELTPGLSLKLYIWNNAKIASKPIVVDMYRRPDNPFEYQFRAK